MQRMLAASNLLRSRGSSYLQNILDAPEDPDLRRLTALVEYLFRVPVAYMALLGTGETVVARIGHGVEYAECLGSLRLDNLLAKPQLIRDSATDLPAGTDLLDLRFAASVLLRSTNGMQFGVLVIADRVPRPDFSAADFGALADLAGVLAGRMELRLAASLALESELFLRDIGLRFRDIANHAPVPLIYSQADGCCTFVNQTWLDFSGRTAEQEMANGWASLVHPDHRRRVTDEWRCACAAQHPFTAEAPMRHRDGAYRWMLGKGVPLFREGGSFDGYAGCMIDLAGYEVGRRWRQDWNNACPVPSGAGQAEC